MKAFFRDLWRLVLNAWLSRELKERDPHVIQTLPPREVADTVEREAPPQTEQPLPNLEYETGVAIANPDAVMVGVVVDEPPAGDTTITVGLPDPEIIEDIVVVPPEPAPEPENFGAATPLVKALRGLGHIVFANGDRPFNLNIVGERNTKNPKLDKFGCRLHVFWKWKGQWHLRSWTATTYPGSRYLIEKLLNRKGAAILKEGQYRDTYQMDLHGGRYRALCQRLKSVIVYRDGDRDREFDMDPDTEMTGMFGINIHAPITVRAGMKNYIASKVYAASAGCQVFQRLQDFLEFRDLCDKAVDEWGNKFTYTLVRDVDIDWSDV